MESCLNGRMKEIALLLPVKKSYLTTGTHFLSRKFLFSELSCPSSGHDFFVGLAIHNCSDVGSPDTAAGVFVGFKIFGADKPVRTRGNIEPLTRKSDIDQRTWFKSPGKTQREKWRAIIILTYESFANSFSLFFGFVTIEATSPPFLPPPFSSFALFLFREDFFFSVVGAEVCALPSSFSIHEQTTIHSFEPISFLSELSIDVTRERAVESRGLKPFPLSTVSTSPWLSSESSTYQHSGEWALPAPWSSYSSSWTSLSQYLYHAGDFGWKTS